MSLKFNPGLIVGQIEIHGKYKYTNKTCNHHFHDPFSPRFVLGQKFFISDFIIQNYSWGKLERNVKAA